ncbi:MAG: hypothetical protein JWO03_663 [Bacteroidetes bacterium]|nr:hypothetical protein [Bacteroidota bacterium]
MAKIILTGEEEIMYLEELDKIQELMPDLEIEVITRPVMSKMTTTNLGEDFRKFLRNTTSTIITGPAFKVA